MSKITKSDILKVLEEYLTVCDSAKNQRNAGFWKNANEHWLIERWRGVSAKSVDAPFLMALDITGYSKVLDINCLDYYSIAEVQLYDQMRYHLWEAKNLRCNRFFDKTAFVSFGATLDGSLFGAKVAFLPSQAPWTDHKDWLLKERDDIKLLPEKIDFKTSGMLGKRGYEFYETMRELVDGSGISVMPPSIARGPFSIATELRDVTKLLMDMLEAPQFMHELMRKITDGVKDYVSQWANYLGEPIAPCKLFNDEISTPMLSPGLYDEFILPYELELAEFHGRVTYWHSCGVTDKFFKSISTIPNLEMMHIGPWSSVEKAVEVFGPCDIALEICLNETMDIYDSTAEQMRQKLQYIKDVCEGKVRYSVRSDGYQFMDSVEDSMKMMRQWNDIAIEVFGTVK